MEQYPACDTGHEQSLRFSKNTQLSADERPVIWQHPETGEIRYPGRNDGEMPSYYKSQGYERKEFSSYQEHQRFNKEHGLINHRAEGIRDEVLKS